MTGVLLHDGGTGGASIYRLRSTTNPLRVVCEAHALDRRVATERHAVNLQQLHDRIDHSPVRPEPVDLSQAAAMVVTAVSDPRLQEEGRGALAVWSALTGIQDLAEAQSYAVSIVSHDHPVLAHIAPF